jgi:hypothetical protein
MLILRNCQQGSKLRIEHVINHRCSYEDEVEIEREKVLGSVMRVFLGNDRQLIITDYEKWSAGLAKVQRMRVGDGVKTTASLALT